MTINTKYLLIDDYSINDYINNNLKEYIKLIESFKGICINPNTNKPLNDDDINSLIEQLKYKLLKNIEGIFKDINTDLVNLYLKTKKRDSKGVQK